MRQAAGGPIGAAKSVRILVSRCCSRLNSRAPAAANFAESASSTAGVGGANGDGTLQTSDQVGVARFFFRVDDMYADPAGGRACIADIVPELLDHGHDLSVDAGEPCDLVGDLVGHEQDLERVAQGRVVPDRFRDGDPRVLGLRGGEGASGPWSAIWR